MTQYDESDLVRQVMDRIVAGLHGGDFQPMVDALDDDVRYWILGTTPFSGTFTSKADYFAFAASTMDDKEGPFTGKVSQLLIDGNRAVMLMDGHIGKKDGGEYANTYAMVFTFSNGKIIDVREYCDTDLMIRAHS